MVRQKIIQFIERYIDSAKKKLLSRMKKELVTKS